MLATSPTPSIEFRVNGFVPNANSHGFVLGIVNEAMTAMGLTGADVRKIIITDNEGYGPAIRQFAPNSGYTKDGVYQGIGKILPEVANGMYSGSNLVLHHCLVGSFVAEQNADRPEGELEAMRYGFYHEFGHCVDHRRRPTQHCAKVPAVTSSPTLRCAVHNGDTLLSEYAACFFSATFLPPAGYGYFARASRLNLETYLTALATKRSQYQLGLGPLTAVSDAALDTFWRGLIEYGKMYAFLNGNQALDPAKDMPTWPARSTSTAQILAKFAEGLRTAWARYPHCEAEFEQLVRETWFALTAAEGFRFEVKPEGDYLWLS